MEYLGDYAGPMPNTRNMVSEFGYHIEFIEYHQPVRKTGHSHYNLFKYMNLALSDMVNTSKVPLRIATIFGMIVAFISVIMGIYYLTLKLRFWNSYELGIPTIETIGRCRRKIQEKDNSLKPTAEIVLKRKKVENSFYDYSLGYKECI